jgi:hypothetical protein
VFKYMQCSGFIVLVVIRLLTSFSCYFSCFKDLLLLICPTFILMLQRIGFMLGMSYSFAA